MTVEERERVLRLVRSAAYRDLAIAQVWAMLLDEGVYLCSQSTMHRLLREAGENRASMRGRRPHFAA